MTKSEAALPAPWLPEGWVEVERVEDRVVADGMILERAGVCVRAPAGEVITGSAAGLRPASMARARFEALERAAVVDVMASEAPMFALRDGGGAATVILPRSELFRESASSDVWRHARSNGVALHDDWGAACDRAWWELCERDRVLRGWHGELEPTLVDVAPSEAPWAAAPSYDWHVARFEAVASGRTATVEVAGVFGFPRRAGLPMIVGYAGRPTLAAAIRAAGDEALQNLAFLWGEDIPSERPAPGPTPVHHLEHLLWPGSHEGLRRWLESGHARFARSPRTGAPELLGFADLTPPWLVGRARVCKAVGRDVTPLTFGEDPRWSHLPPDLQMHPIP